MNKTLINILGPGRSGTTMLDLMLGNDDESFSMGEVCALFRPFRKHHFHIDCNCGDPKCPYWNKLKYLKENELHEKAFETLKVNYIIDSSKELPWVIDSEGWARNNSIQTINFLMYKPIINYCYSFWKREKSIEGALHQYKLYYNRFFQSGLKAFSVSYEELIHNPEDTLNMLCMITGQHPFSHRKEFWNKKHHHLFGSGGIRKQAHKGQSQIKPEALPDDFKRILPKFKEITDRDSSLKLISEKLNRIDFKTYKIENDNYKKLINIKPYWYYYLKAKRNWKAKFPESYFNY